jgi:O-antigen ligase
VTDTADIKGVVDVDDLSSLTSTPVVATPLSLDSAVGEVAPPATRSPRHARLLWVPVACSVILFGAVYQWVYVPVLVSAAAVGAYGWWTAGSRHREPLRGIAAALLVVALAIGVQLVPMPISWLLRVSPATDTVVRQLDLGYEAARSAGTAVLHPISIAPAETAKGLAMFLALSVFLLGATAMMPRVRVKWLIRRLAALGLALAVFGIVQRATYNGKLYWVFAPIDIASNSFGPFVNRNHFAGWMLMAGALTAGYLCSLMVPRGSRRRRLTWQQRIATLAAPDGHRLLFISCALAVMVLSIVWTLSRSGIIALGVATALMSVFVSIRFRGARRAATAGFLLAVVAFALSWKGLDTVLDWYSRTSTLEWRFHLWRDTLAIIRDFRWFGTGLDTYGVSTMLYPTSDPAWHAKEAHNDYVQILSEGGVLLGTAAILAIWQLARTIRAAFALPQLPSLYWVRVGATVGLVAIAVQELTDFSLQMPANALLFALLAAIAMHRPPRHQRPTG